MKEAHYLGEQGDWDSRGNWCRGAIGFWPAFDGRVSRIGLMPAVTAARAAIRVAPVGTALAATAGPVGGHRVTWPTGQRQYLGGSRAR
jgi:dolichol kinase